MKNLRRIIWGIIFVAAAVVIALNSFGIINFDIFFDGWWTLFIIVPSFAGLIENKNKMSSLSGLGIGILLLLCYQNILNWDIIWKIALPIIIGVIGIKMIVSSFRKEKTSRIVNNIKIEGRDMQSGFAVFSGTELNFDDVVFDGAELTAVFGGVECNLTKAIIDRDCVIKVTCAFGGIDIKVPDNVKVVNNVACIFGGVDVDKSNNNAPYTLYIEGVCTFGGVDVE
jgi:predicted membrane protein